MNTGKRMLPEPKVRVSGSQVPSLPLPELGGPMQNHSISKLSVSSTANEGFRWNNKQPLPSSIKSSTVAFSDETGFHLQDNILIFFLIKL